MSIQRQQTFVIRHFVGCYWPMIGDIYCLSTARKWNTPADAASYISAQGLPDTWEVYRPTDAELDQAEAKVAAAYEASRRPEF